MRLFVAIDLPRSLQKKLSELKQDFPHSHWVPEDQLHLTLRFIGDAEERLAQEIQQALQSIHAPSIELSLKGVGCFPNERFPRVLWVGMNAEQALAELQKKIEEKLQEVGIAAEMRPFSPHITLARLKSANPKCVAKFLTQQKDFGSDPFLIDEFFLYSSTLSPRGAIHEKIATYRLI